MDLVERLRRGERNLVFATHGTGPPVLFAHGLSGTHADAAWLVEPAHGFRLIVPDLFGRGASFPATVVEAHTFEEYARDNAAILDHEGVDRAIVCGVSFGAAVAIAFTLAFPGRVTALLLLASAFGGKEDPMGEGDLARYGALGERMARDGVRTVAQSEAARIGSTRPIERWTQHHEGSVAAWMRAVPQYRPFARASDLAAVGVPTLVVSGNDGIHTPELSRSYAGAIPEATLIAPGASLADTVDTFLAPFRTAGP